VRGSGSRGPVRSMATKGDLIDMLLAHQAARKPASVPGPAAAERATSESNSRDPKVVAYISSSQGFNVPVESKPPPPPPPASMIHGVPIPSNAPTTDGIADTWKQQQMDISQHLAADTVQTPLLRVYVCGHFIGRIGSAVEGVKDVLEEDYVGPVYRLPPTIIFVRSDGSQIVHDLSSHALQPFTAKFLHLNVRVHGAPAYAVQTDCILAHSAEESARFSADVGQMSELFNGGQIFGVRIQPFFLAERREPPPPAGLNLFERGLHYPDTVTPIRTSLSCLCDACGGSFRLSSYHAMKKRFEISYVYCSSGIHAITMSKYEPGAPPLLADPTAREWSDIELLERRLPECEHCAGTFAFCNPFRCPHCSAPFLDYASPPMGPNGKSAGRRGEVYWCELHAGPTARPWGISSVHPGY
jgi:hypothetical protein